MPFYHLCHLSKGIKEIGNMKKKYFFIVGILILVFIGYSCKENKSNLQDNRFSLEDSWYFTENDSLYGEIFFTKNHFWLYTEMGGVVSQKYKYENDSIEFMTSFSIPYYSGEFNRINKDEFYTRNTDVTTYYHRLSTPIDTLGLMRSDQQVYHEYVKEFLERKRNWEVNKKK
jgi:hypothetical protein